MDAPSTVLARVRRLRGRLATTAAQLESGPSEKLDTLASIEARLDQVVADVALINRCGRRNRQRGQTA